jgi:uncharacterized protein (TIGR02246 family)
MMKPLLLVTIILTLAACGPAPDQTSNAQDTTEQDVAALKAILDRFVDAFNRGDAAGVVADATDDAIWVPAEAEPVAGKAAIQAAYQATLDRYEEAVTTETQEDVGIDGGLAYALQRWTVTGTVKETSVKEENFGHVLVVSKRQPDGTWKWHRAVWNYDHPYPHAE